MKDYDNHLSTICFSGDWYSIKYMERNSKTYFEYALHHQIIEQNQTFGPTS